MTDFSQLPPRQAEALDDLRRVLGIGGGGKASLTQREIARALSGALLAQWPADWAQASTGNASLGELVGHLIGALWPENGQENKEEYARLLQQLGALEDPVLRAAAAGFIAQMGHMHQLAGLLVRDHTLQRAVQGNGERSLSTAEAFLKGELGSKRGKIYTNAADAVAALTKPAFELTLTAHPTNTNGLATMKAQRELGNALSRWRSNPSDDAGVIAALQNYDATGLLSFRNDGQPGFTVRDEVQQMLHYLNNGYEDLGEVYASYDRALNKQFGAEYAPADLRLNVKFHSWGSSGDKDGKDTVTADTTLYALAAHHEQILTRYLTDIPQWPALADWHKKMRAAQTQATTVRERLEEVLTQGGHLDEEEFNRLQSDFKNAVAPLGAKALSADLETLQTTVAEPVKTQLLDAIRRLHTFGFSFGTIEYRETAEEYTRIVAAMFHGYENLGEQERCTVLNGILNDPERRKWLAERLREIGEDKAGMPYSKEHAGPIAYQTRKRMELARDFPDAIKNNVLAECKSTSNMLEALLLQHAVTDANGKRATLGIVPLFEDAEPFRNAPLILMNALRESSYREHLGAVARAQNAKPAQQIQAAHSDNVRRNGLLAGRELIKTNIERVREVFDIHNSAARIAGLPEIELQQYYGGSQSDPYRGGTRAISATVNEFGLWEFTKMTFQGGDLLNYLNQHFSFFRLLMRNITHSAARLTQKPAMESGARKSHDQAVSRALAATQAPYIELFQSNEFESFLKEIGFDEEALFSNAAARAGARSSVNKRVDSRTITFSEAMQHAGLVPTWLGCLALKDALPAHIKDANSPRTLHKLYDKESAIFRDVIDRMLYGLVRSDMPYLRERSGDHPLMERFEREYEVAFKLCLEAYTGQPIEQLTGGRTLSPAQQHDLLIDTVFELEKPIFKDQDRYIKLVRSLKRNWHPSQDESSQLGMLLHNGMDTVLHGRIPLLDDTTFATLYEQITKQWRSHGPLQKAANGRAAAHR